MLTLIQLRHFLALAEAASFSRAAERVHLTQPAFSRSVRALEDELGELLFDRLGHRAELTVFGRTALENARRIVQIADDLRASGRDQGKGRSGRLRIGLGAGPGAMLMAPLLTYAAERRGAFKIEISRGDTAPLTSGLRERRLDVVIVDSRSLIPAEDLHVDPINEMRAAFMARAEHPLTRRRGKLTFRAVAAYPLATAPLSAEIARAMVEQYGPEALPARCIRLQCDDIGSLVEVARRTDAVLLAVRAVAPDLVELPIHPGLMAKARFACVTLAHRAPAPALAAIRAHIGAWLRDASDDEIPRTHEI